LVVDTTEKVNKVSPPHEGGGRIPLKTGNAQMIYLASTSPMGTHTITKRRSTYEPNR
jgi:hypothetical protein